MRTRHSERQNADIQRPKHALFERCDYYFPNTFTSTTSYFCVANDVTTRANPVQMVPASATTATITNTTGGSDVIQWVCVGN
jgi:hypothetical protein